MGAWEELDTRIEGILESDDLDSIMSLDDPYGFIDPYKEIAKELKDKYLEGVKLATEDLAHRNMSFQDQTISKVCANPSGILASSIDVEQIGESTYLIGTTINHIYPMSLEYGRRGFEAINAKALAFYDENGELIFRKSVGPAEPRPFVAPAYDETMEIAKEVFLRYVGGATVEVFGNGG